ncbi:glycine N-acyltransferase-like [Terrapene carolina triunguis]|uniref:glycine N-acyltransferase-like n=1 Tax=Terrapene triunguis TaxID=2587831 RepID=UPI0011566D1C|nr:glycine N-acyltransferase-like [Terrapene carolina triunguis]
MIIVDDLMNSACESDEIEKAFTKLDPDMRVSSLDVSHSDLLNETWVFGGNEKSRKYLASLIRHFPSVCLLDAAGHPVSWIASDLFGAMEPGYTLPQHRRRGYMGMLTNLIAKRLHALGYLSYGFVAMENYPMQRLQERQGFQRQPSLCYFILHNTALAKAPTLTPSPALGTAPVYVLTCLLHLLCSSSPASPGASCSAYYIYNSSTQVASDNSDFYTNMYAEFYQALLGSADVIN